MFFIHEEKQIYSLVNKKCPRPATTDPNEPYNIESRAQGMFSTSKIPRSLKGFRSRAQWHLWPQRGGCELFCRLASALGGERVLKGLTLGMVVVNVRS